MTYHSLLIAASLVITPIDATARADTNFSAFKDMINRTLEEAAECDVGQLDIVGLGVSQSLNNTWGQLFVTGIQTEGCNGGNNYGYNVSIYELSSNASRILPMEPLGFPWIDSIQPKEIKGVPTISIVGPDYAPEDARCCPSLNREVRIWAEEDGIKWKIVKTWKK